MDIQDKDKQTEKQATMDTSKNGQYRDTDNNGHTPKTNKTETQRKQYIHQRKTIQRHRQQYIQ